MDDLGQEGIVGTFDGNLYYMNMQEKQLIRIVSRVSQALDDVSIVKFDPCNQAVFMTSSGTESGDVKLFTTATMDQVI